jgi:uncharacterized membrane protein
MAAATTDHPLERLVFFSDAVFAIAITLLVIEIHPPELPNDASNAEHWRALAHLAPSFVGYLVSFLVIGIFWMGHHRAFALARHYHPPVLKWNLGLLGVIAFMPFLTAYLSTYSNASAQVPAVMYCIFMFLAALLNLKVNWTATAPPMVDEGVPREEIDYVRRRGISVVLGSATAIVTSIVLPFAGQVGLVSIPLWRRVLAAIAKRRQDTASA